MQARAAIAMLPQDVDRAITRIEHQLQTVADAVARGAPLALEQACSQLRLASADFSRLAQGRQDLFSTPEMKRRLERIVESMAMQREGLIRRSAQTERTLSVLMPKLAAATTYVQSGIYGSAQVGARQYAA